MDNHPIPQDVTGFQFKLIGDMTVKQFAYLAGGVIIGWIFFSLPISAILRLPMAAFFIFLGISLAFLPIAGRPLDLMLGNFIKALFSPTQFIYQKTDTNLLFPKLAGNLKFNINKKGQKSVQTQNTRLKVFLRSSLKTPKNKLDEKEANFFSALFGHKTNIKTFENTNPSSPHILSVNPEDKPKTDQSEKEQKPTIPEENLESFKKKALLIEQELARAKEEELVVQKQPAAAAAPLQHQKVLDLEAELAGVLKEKELLTQQLLALQRRLGVQKQELYTPSIASFRRETQNVRRIPNTLGKAAGLPIAPDIPNLVSGIVKNPRGQPLPNILIEVKDSEGNPVRAFKTNGIGQFASATPLLNGTYTITFEDATGQNKFDAIEFTANSEIILPIEVVSVDQREELRKSLFQGN